MATLEQHFEQETSSGSSPTVLMMLAQEAIQNLQSTLGIHICDAPSNTIMALVQEDSYKYDLLQQICSQQWNKMSTTTTSTNAAASGALFVSAERFLFEEAGEEEEGSTASIVFNLLATVFCVSLAAVAAGLTLGMLGLDPLMLLIKERAAEDPTDRKCAKKLIPVVKQHHRLLVTLLLMNSLANEALPIFLEALVSPTVAILLSVTLVLFFGEIIPAAIFTGPAQIKIASKLTGLVRFAMFILYPVAGPIAYLLDRFLHDEEDNSYNRGELSALIRIQYEERLATKRQHKMMRQNQNPNQVGALDFTQSIRASERRFSRNERNDSDSIHYDEVTMIEGALQMKTSTAIDYYTKMRDVFCLSGDLKLTEANMIRIYSAGFSRVPIYEQQRSNIIGVLIIKKLIVVDPNHERVLKTIPLTRPICVPPHASLVDLLNVFQTGGKVSKGGHMALVCARPDLGNDAMARDKPLPLEAGLMGIITLEDVLEALLQEQIYDEMDRTEKNAARLAKMVIKKWKQYVARKKNGELASVNNEPMMVPVVQKAIEEAAEQGEIAVGMANELTSLLGNNSKK